MHHLFVQQFWSHIINMPAVHDISLGVAAGGKGSSDDFAVDCGFLFTGLAATADGVKIGG